MINILVPTDFSALSKVAFKYAIKIANEVNGTVTLLHFVSSVEPVTNAMRHRVKPVEDEVMADAHDKLQKLAGNPFHRDQKQRHISRRCK
jgi:nucleotide-binding universal stress UspA family protein